MGEQESPQYVNLQKPLKEREIKGRVLPLATSLEKLNIEGASLGIVKPDILDIEVKVNRIDAYDRQQYFNLIGDFLEIGERARIPVEVKCVFRCEGEDACRGHKVIVLDWEFNETVRNIIRNEQKPSDIKRKIGTYFVEHSHGKELYFIMGTHFTYGTWMITGLFCPERNGRVQSNLFRFQN